MIDHRSMSILKMLLIPITTLRGRLDPLRGRIDPLRGRSFSTLNFPKAYHTYLQSNCFRGRHDRDHMVAFISFFV